jgi:hypothetical protein
MKIDRPVTAWSSFPHIETAEELEEYLTIRPKGHSGYYHYTSLAAINGILNDGFCISSVDRFNDTTEKDIFKGKEKKAIDARLMDVEEPKLKELKAHAEKEKKEKNDRIIKAIQALNNEGSDLRSQVQQHKKRVEEINKELTKDR